MGIKAPVGQDLGKGTHIHESRLLQLAERGLRMDALELKHMENCEACLDIFSKTILGVARSRARKKMRRESAF